MYAKAFFKRLDADAITVAPYMGSDSVKPFLAFPGKWAIVLGLTSNEGSSDFQMMKVNNEELYLNVIRTCSAWGNDQNMMFVVGATKAQMLSGIRQIIPDHFLLVPGVGAQGGSLEEVCKYGMNSSVGLLVNVSRNIIYADNGKDFALKAGEEAKKLADQMKNFIPR
jgi:orotidine-5'-phosphate decarboxylase